MEGSAYRVQWVGGEPVIVQDMESAMRLKLSRDEEQFITQHARDTKEAEQSRQPAAAPEVSKAQRSSRRSGGSKQAPAATGAAQELLKKLHLPGCPCHFLPASAHIAVIVPSGVSEHAYEKWLALCLLSRAFRLVHRVPACACPTKLCRCQHGWYLWSAAEPSP